MSEETTIEEIEEDAVEDQGSDLTAMLTEAYDEAEAETSDPSGGDSSGETSSVVPGTEGANDTSAGAKDGQPAGDAGGGGHGGGKPPIDWSPELREEWGGLSETVKGQIANRENQIANAMQGTAQARSIANEFTGVANQYGSVMAAEGVKNPVQMFDNVMRTVSELRMGTPQQKANRMAELIQNYGVDLSTLDAALTGAIKGEAPQAGPNDAMEQMLDQRMAPVNQMMQQLAGMQQQKQHGVQQNAMNEVNTFAQGAEFLQDVRHDVADLMDLATRQGREMPLKEAYDKACAMNPQIASVMEQRATQAKLVGNQSRIAGKRNAGSSLAPGSPRSQNSTPTGNLYDAISAAWDDQVG
jgi:hypothetical protein